MVEERDACLDRACHRHLVHPHQQQLGEPVLQLEVGHLLEQVGAGKLTFRVLPQPLDDLVRVGMRAPVREDALLELALVGDRAAPEGEPALGGLLDRLRVSKPAPGAPREGVGRPADSSAQGSRHPLEGRPVARAEARMADVRLVAVKELVRALADLHDDRLVVARKLREVVQRHGDPVGERLVLLVDQLREERDEVF